MSTILLNPSNSLPRSNDDLKPVQGILASVVSNRAFGLNPLEAFGSHLNVYELGYETLIPSTFKPPITDTNFRVNIGNSQCLKPYSCSILNSSALSYGPLSRPFIVALNKAASLGNFFQNTGEAGLSPFHLGLNDIDINHSDFDTTSFFKDYRDSDKLEENHTSGHLVWEIGSGYFGCRNSNGYLDQELFELKSSLSSVKMIEIKLSQGIEPAKALPVKTLTPGIAKVLGVDINQPVSLPYRQLEFTTPKDLLFYVDRLRKLAGGKPVGIKLGIGHYHEFFSICKAMLATEIIPDFLTVDGMEGGTSGTKSSLIGYSGTPLDDALVFVHNALTGIGLREHIRIIASGRIFTERDILSKIARGADLCSTARGMLLAAGCTQQRDCYRGDCKSGIATQDEAIMNMLDIGLTAQKIFNYHQITLEELSELVSIAGLTHPCQIRPDQIRKRTSYTESKALDKLYTFIPKKSLLKRKKNHLPESYIQAWNFADPERDF